MGSRRIVIRTEEEIEVPPGEKVVLPHSQEEVVVPAEEAVRVEPSPPPDPETRKRRGFVLGALLGGSVGGVVLLPLALVPLAGSLVTRALAVMIAGWVVGTLVAVAYWKRRSTELRDKQIEIRR
jgi:outer membrane lipoprotein SlyB